MKKSQLSSLAVVSVIGALTCFLWLPLLPLIVPLVTIGGGLKWASRVLLAEPSQEAPSAPLKHHTNPITPFSQSHANEAWPSLASLPYPAGAGSLPFSLRNGSKEKSARRLRREDRQIARVMRGLELRRTAMSS